jgi:hypothetical protein
MEDSKLQITEEYFNYFIDKEQYKNEYNDSGWP